MEEKKVKAGNVAIGICLFVIAILLVFIVLFFYNSNKEKNETNLLLHNVNIENKHLKEKNDLLNQRIKEKEEKVIELENNLQQYENEGQTNIDNEEEKISELETMVEELNDKIDELENFEEIKESPVRTYRFFGTVDGSSPDMYTTLKLYSNEKYDFYLNRCSEIVKYSGNYSETNENIILIANSEYDYDICLIKKDNGNYLEFGTDILVFDSGGKFCLESFALEWDGN